MPKSGESRSTVDILKDLCGFNPSTSKPLDRLPHDCYMIQVGGLTDREDLLELQSRMEGQNVNQKDSDQDQAEYALMNSEEIEFILERMTLAGSTEQFENTRTSHYVYEDNFNSSLKELIESRASYEKLKHICAVYEGERSEDVARAMLEHEKRVKLSHNYFLGKNVPMEEAKAMSFAISFYTGAKSESCSRAASLIARRGNKETFETKTEQELNEAAIILYYLVKALSHIPFYWGYVTRACQLTFDELQMYQPGRVVTWIQFSSSKKGKKGHDSAAFKDRNTLFKIYSLTGRPIKDFSNYAEEDEVLFLPHSTFIVFNRVVYKKEGRQVIYMRQVELGFCAWSVMWVDDNIFDEEWENKAHMEYAAVKSLDINVHFIPKSSTESALSFLRSPFGQRLKNAKNFRIVTDMNRHNEKPYHNAGARLIKAVRRMGFSNQCLVFTSDRQIAEEIVESELNSKERQGVAISASTSDLRKFLNFDQKPSPSQLAAIDHKTNKSNYGATNYSTHASASKTHGGASNDAYFNVSEPEQSGYMHNSINTDIEVIINNCHKRNLANNRYNCVLLTTGSFNPIHPWHFRNLQYVKEYLEQEHTTGFNVLAGYISPTHDDYVRHKLGDTHWIPARDRCRLAEEALKTENDQLSSWIRISRGESEWDGGFVDFGPVTENLRDFLNDTLVHKKRILKHPIYVIYVCGLDHYNKCSHVEKMAKQTNISSAVVFRVGYAEKQIDQSMKASGVIYIPLSQKRSTLTEVSSTLIREYFQKPTASAKAIEPYIYPVVRQYMSKKYKK